jgi:hypothetical protein
MVALPDLAATPKFGKQSARFGSRDEDFALVRRLNGRVLRKQSATAQRAF